MLPALLLTLQGLIRIYFLNIVDNKPKEGDYHVEFLDAFIGYLCFVERIAYS